MSKKMKKSDIRLEHIKMPKGRRLIFKFYRTTKGDTMIHECKLNGLCAADIDALFVQVKHMKRRAENLTRGRPDETRIK